MVYNKNCAFQTRVNGQLGTLKIKKSFIRFYALPNRIDDNLLFKIRNSCIQRGMRIVYKNIGRVGGEVAQTVF